MNRIADAGSMRVWEDDWPIPYETLVDWCAGVDGLYCLLTDRIDDQVLEAAGPQLKVISQMAVGVDNIDAAACTRRGVPVGHTPGVLTGTTADLAIALMLAVMRRLTEAVEFVKQGRWQTWRPMEMTGRDLTGSTVGIIGLGRIGQAVAKRLRGFDCKLLYTQPERDLADGIFGASYVDFETLLHDSDVVTLHCPLKDDTRGLINTAALRQMKPTAILINTARGPMVDQDALLEAARDGTIAAAGLDVTTPEPLPADHPLLTLPNVVVLPHVGSATIGTRLRMAHMAVDNLLAGLAGERLPHCFNPQVYEKS
jgi:lactate dehydrogenase-like 2-hydroxyacid dehydrogenase